MKSAFYDKVVAHVNRKRWWHVPPLDRGAYRKRGKFLASSFTEAVFWGRPLDDPLRVTVANPLFGDEATIERTLFGKRVSNGDITVNERWKLDTLMKKTALAMGYDSILLMAPKTFAKFESTGKIPRSLELNILAVV
jgi:hypothetical protein